MSFSLIQFQDLKAQNVTVLALFWKNSIAIIIDEN